MPDKASKSGKPLGPIGTKVLFENEHIRVWSVELPPKGHQPLHEHEHPYLVVPVSEGKALMRWEDGREREITDVSLSNWRKVPEPSTSACSNATTASPYLPSRKRMSPNLACRAGS